MATIWTRSKKAEPHLIDYPEEAADVQIFRHMPNALISGGKLVKAGHKIILDNPIATVINKLTNEIVMEATFDPQSCTGMCTQTTRSLTISARNNYNL